MKARGTSSVSICVAAAAVIGVAVMSADRTGPAPIGAHEPVRKEDIAAPAPPPPQPDQRSLGGFIAAWSGQAGPTSTPHSPPVDSTDDTMRAERQQAHEREVATVAVRMLQLQARQDPQRAAFYLSQINDKAAVPATRASPRQYRQAEDRQRQVNDYMAAKIDRLRAAQPR